MGIRFRRTWADDLDFVLSAERDAENSPFVFQWTREQHAAALAAPDLAHFIIETVADEKRAGYVILAGLTDPNSSVEFKRIVVTEKGKGFGRQAVRLTKRLAFEEWRAHRLWLDVVAHNTRAQAMYETEGFVREGILRECLKVDAGFESLIVMSILRDEYLDALPAAGVS